MRIAASGVALAASRVARVEQVREESLLVRIGNPDFIGAGRPSASGRPGEDRLSLSAAAPGIRNPAAAPDEAGVDETAGEDPRLRTIRIILEALTGREVKVGRLALEKTTGPAPVSGRDEGARQQPAAAGWGIDYTLREAWREQETTSFFATGRLMTSEGRLLDFRLELVMHREFATEVITRLQFGDALLTDPLIVNFDGGMVELGKTAFSFDLDLDGRADNLPALRSGSGYLVLDRNGDGVINDGSELFGPATGSGFAELARCDQDGNGWIDHNDDVFDQLAVWVLTDDGRNYLASLRTLRIGALLLEPAAAPFALKDESNNLLGQVRSTSVFVREDGSAGTVQEIDLVA